MDRGDLSRWYKHHVGGDQNILSPTSGETASSVMSGQTRLPSLNPNGSGIAEHSPTPGGILPGLQMTSPGTGSYLSIRDSNDQREMLAAAAGQSYPAFMWHSPLLPHPDLLSTQPNPLTGILPTTPLLLSDTFPPYMGRHLPTLPDSPSWRRALTSPTSVTSGSTGKTNAKRNQHGNNSKIISPSKNTCEEYDIKKPAVIISPKQNVETRKANKKMTTADEEKRTQDMTDEVSPKRSGLTSATPVNGRDAVLQVKVPDNNQTVQADDKVSAEEKTSPTFSDSKQVEGNYPREQTSEAISVSSNSNQDNSANVRSDISSISRNNNAHEKNIDTDIFSAVRNATNVETAVNIGAINDSAVVLNTGNDSQKQHKRESENGCDSTTDTAVSTLTGVELILKTKLKSEEENHKDSPPSCEIVSKVGDKSGHKKDNGSVHIKRKSKSKSVDDIPEDTDTDIDVGDEMTSCSYQCSVSNNHGQGKGGEVRKIHATTYTPEVGGAIPEILKTDLSSTTAIDLTTTCPVNKSKQEKTVVKQGPSSATSSVSSSTPSSSVSISVPKTSPECVTSLGSASINQQQMLLTPPNYMSFDPRILSFYTIEEREKLIQGGWIPACYSPNSKELPPVFSQATAEGLLHSNNKDILQALPNVSSLSGNKVGVSGLESKSTASDKKSLRDGVSKKSSAATSNMNTSTIPVGIAIARKRQDTSSERREQERPAVEQMRPLTSESNTVPNRASSNSTTTTSTSGLTSNLVITGGSSEYWLGHGPYSLPPSTREGAQLQYNPPPGYKIAGDPITGQLYVIPDMTRGFGPGSPLPSPSSSLKSTEPHPSLDSASLDHRMTITPLSVLSPGHIHHPAAATNADIVGRSPRTPSRSSTDESSRGRPGSHDHVVSTTTNHRTATASVSSTISDSRSQESRSSTSSQSTTGSACRDDGRISSAVSPPFRQGMVQSPSLQPNYSYPSYPYYPYYWGHSHPPYTPPQFSTQVRTSSRGNNNNNTNNTTNASSSSSAVTSPHQKPGNELPASTKSKSTVSVQTLQNPLSEIGVQTCNTLVETSVQTEDIDQISSQGIETNTTNQSINPTQRCTCSCHDRTESQIEDKVDEAATNSANKSVSSDNSADDNSDGLHILSTLASHLDFFTPITVATEDDLSSVYNGPRSTYYDRTASFSGYRRAKTPSSDDTGSVFRFGSDSMVSMEVEVRTRLAEIQRLYKEKQKQLGKLKRKDSEGPERRHSRTKSRTTSKSQSESDPLSPKTPASPKPMRKTKAQLKYMQHTPVVDFQDTPSSENKDSEMEELRTLFEDTILGCNKDRTGEDQGKKSEGNNNSSPLDGLSDGAIAFASTPLGKLEKRFKRKSSQGTELSHAKKRKPGRPKKFGKGVTQTLVSKSSKHFSFLCIEDEDRSEKETSSSNEEEENDDWKRRRSERIFLNDKTPVSPQKPEPFMEGTQPLNSNMKNVTKKKEIDRAKNLSEKVRKKYRNLEPTRKYSKLTIKKEEKPTLSHSCSTSSDDIPLSEIKSKVTSSGKEKSPAITENELKDGLKILYFMDGLFYEGFLKEIHPPDVYGVHVNGERGNRPHILPREEILENVFLDKRVQDSNELPVGQRICAYWSQQFSCMYPGMVVEGVGLPKTARGRGLVNVEFDDGDTGKISVEHVRLLPQDFPFQGDSDDEPETPTKQKKGTEEKLPESWRERQPVHPDTHSSENKAQQGGYSKDFKRCNSTPVKRKVMVSKKQKRSHSTSDRRKDEESDESEGEEEGTRKVKRSLAKKKNVSLNGGQKKGNTVLPAHQIWQWQEGSRRLASKGKAKRIYYGAIQRGKEVIKVGESAVFLTVGRPNLPYIGRVECFYENRSGHMVVKVKWFYHPEETKGGKKLAEIRGALYESPHGDENDVQTISHKCHVMSYTRYKTYRQTHSGNDMTNVYYLAGFYDPTVSLIKFEGDVKLI